MERTGHKNISVAEGTRLPDMANLEAELKELLRLAGEMDGEAIRKRLHETVASFGR